MRVLIVDDSVVFRSQIKTALEGVAGIEVYGVANNGRIALQKLAQGSIDLITLDMEMPEMSGLETIREIKRNGFKVKIIVFSSSTARGSENTLAALSSGADDYVSKPSGPDATIETAALQIKNELVPKILQFEQGHHTAPLSSPISSPKGLSNLQRAYIKKDLALFRPSVVVIGASTGGPPALERALKEISKSTRIPILIVQHMPPVFTATLASRLQNLTGIPTLEAKMGMPLQEGRIYVAPGNYHSFVRKEKDGTILLRLDQGPLRNSVRPAVDHLFESTAEVYGPKCLAIVLTGMGEDGKSGCIKIKEAGGGVMIQNQESCVVFGMPGAVFEEKAFDAIGNLDEINSLIKRVTS